MDFILGEGYRTMDWIPWVAVRTEGKDMISLQILNTDQESHALPTEPVRQPWH